ncbi:MAG: alpha-L-rhamnosidase, partial [Firmicutes bacterium]|nr:alpha-L-rhamnosidase [Candidatus Caballimonas caccae]
MIEDRVKEYIFPKKIVKYSESVENPSNLLIEKELQIATVERDLIFVKGKGFIILDFGEEMYGGVRILSKACQTSKEEKGETPVRLRFGESLTECCVELGEKNATNNHALRDFVIHLESHSDMEFGNTGFR